MTPHTHNTYMYITYIHTTYVVGALCQTCLSQSTGGPPAAWISQPVSHFPLWKFPYFFVSRGTTTFERLRSRAGDGQGWEADGGRIVEALGVCGPIVNGDRLAEYVMATVSFSISLSDLTQLIIKICLLMVCCRCFGIYRWIAVSLCEFYCWIDEKSSEKLEFKGRVKGPKNSTMRVTGFEEFASYSAQRTAEFQIILAPSKVAFYPWNTSGSHKNECGKTTNDFWLKSLARLEINSRASREKNMKRTRFHRKNMELKSFAARNFPTKRYLRRIPGWKLLKKKIKGQWDSIRDTNVVRRSHCLTSSCQIELTFVKIFTLMSAAVFPWRRIFFFHNIWQI